MTKINRLFVELGPWFRAHRKMIMLAVLLAALVFAGSFRHRQLQNDPRLNLYDQIQEESTKDRLLWKDDHDQ